MGTRRGDEQEEGGGRYTDRPSGEDPGEEEVTRDEDAERVDTPAGREQDERRRA
jgi:hypothetical protein